MMAHEVRGPRRGSTAQALEGGAGSWSRSAPEAWTLETVRRLGMTTDVTIAAQILGIGRTLAFDLLKHDQFPVRVSRIGRRVVVPIADLLRLLGAGPPAEG
jgi:hypothetical protein